MLIALLLIWKKQLRFSRPASGILVALLAVSILSGCAPMFAMPSPEIYQLIKEREYKHYTIQKYAIFGLGLDELTIETAQFEGDIETVYVAKLEQGYGIVSVGRVTVAGK